MAACGIFDVDGTSFFDDAPQQWLLVVYFLRQVVLGDCTYKAVELVCAQPFMGDDSLVPNESQYKKGRAERQYWWTGKQLCSVIVKIPIVVIRQALDGNPLERFLTNKY